MLLPFHKMNRFEIFKLTAEYPEFIENDECFTFLKQLAFLNHNVMKIANGEPLIGHPIMNGLHNPSQPAINNGNTDTAASSSSTQTTSSSTSSSSPGDSNDNNGNSTQPQQTSTEESTGMPLNELIEFLVMTDIKPIEYNRDLLVTQLISQEITNQNVVQQKAKMLSILEDCQFPKNRAEFTMEQIERNLSTQHVQTSTTTTSTVNNNNNNSNTQLATCPINGGAPEEAAEPEEEEDTVDENGINVVDLTQMAVETVYEGRVIVQRNDILQLYRKHDIDSTRLMLLTENEFAAMFQEMQWTQHSKTDCIKIHRLIKTWLNVPSKFRYNIDIALAIIYLVNEDNTFSRSIEMEPAAVRHAFANYSARRVHKMGKKAFIKLVQSQTQIKMGHGTKLWSALKAYIEDCNVVLPPQIVIADYKDEEEIDGEQQQQPQQEEEVQPEANGHSNHVVIEVNGHHEEQQQAEKVGKSETEKDDDYKQPHDHKASVMVKDEQQQQQAKEFERNKNINLPVPVNDIDPDHGQNKMQIDAMETVKV